MERLSETARHLSDLGVCKNLVALCLEVQYSFWRRSAPDIVIAGTLSSARDLEKGAGRERPKTTMVATGVGQP